MMAILLHDCCYVGSPDMDGEFGEQHPVRSAALLLKIFGTSEGSIEAADEILGHSRRLCARWGIGPSKLCAADKMALAFECRWFYLLRVRLSGEIEEYKANAVNSLSLPPEVTDRQWFDWARAKCVSAALNQEHATARSR
jgi:hypothetical protein